MTRDRIDECHPRRATKITVAGVEDTGSDACLVAHSHKAWHIGLYHHVFLCHRLILDKAIVHLTVGGQSHHTPGGDTLGEGKLNGYLTICIACQCGIEECRLRKVLSQLDRLSPSFCVLILAIL